MLWATNVALATVAIVTTILALYNLIPVGALGKRRNDWRGCCASNAAFCVDELGVAATNAADIRLDCRIPNVALDDRAVWAAHNRAIDAANALMIDVFALIAVTTNPVAVSLVRRIPVIAVVAIVGAYKRKRDERSHKC